MQAGDGSESRRWLLANAELRAARGSGIPPASAPVARFFPREDKSPQLQLLPLPTSYVPSCICFTSHVNLDARGILYVPRCARHEAREAAGMPGARLARSSAVASTQR